MSEKQEIAQAYECNYCAKGKWGPCRLILELDKPHYSPAKCPVYGGMAHWELIEKSEAPDE